MCSASLHILKVGGFQVFVQAVQGQNPSEHWRAVEERDISKREGHWQRRTRERGSGMLPIERIGLLCALLIAMLDESASFTGQFHGPAFSSHVSPRQVAMSVRRPLVLGLAMSNNPLPGSGSSGSGKADEAAAASTAADGVVVVVGGGGGKPE